MCPDFTSPCSWMTRDSWHKNGVEYERRGRRRVWKIGQKLCVVIQFMQSFPLALNWLEIHYGPHKSGLQNAFIFMTCLTQQKIIWIFQHLCPQIPASMRLKKKTKHHLTISFSRKFASKSFSSHEVGQELWICSMHFDALCRLRCCCCWNVFSKVNWKVCRGSADPWGYQEAIRAALVQIYVKKYL